MSSESNNYFYRKNLAEQMDKYLESHNPRKDLKDRKDVTRGPCPNCPSKDDFFRIPEFNYGRCTECSYEEGFEYYSEVIQNRERDYDDLQSKVRPLLREWVNKGG